MTSPIPPSNLGTRTSDVSKMDRFNEALSGNMERYTQSQTRLSTSAQNDRYNTREMAPQTKAYLGYDQHSEEISAMKSKITNLNGRLKYSLTISQRLQDIASEVRERVMKASDATASQGEFGQFCTDKLKEVEGLLNKRDAEGRNLFAGSSTRDQAVDLSLAPVPAGGSTPDSTYVAYFKGKSGGFNTQLRTNETFNYGFSADANPVRDLVFWLKMGTAVTPSTDPANPNRQKMSQMLDGLGTTVDSFADLSSKIGSQLGKLDALLEENRDDELYIQQSMQAINEANMLQEFINASMEFTRLSMNQLLMQREMQNANDLVKRM